MGVNFSGILAVLSNCVQDKIGISVVAFHFKPKNSSRGGKDKNVVLPTSDVVHNS